MEHSTLIFNCIACRLRACANPHKVPSLRVRIDHEGRMRLDPKGAREPLCARCAEAVNANRVKAGLAPMTIDASAYQPVPEHAL